MRKILKIILVLFCVLILNINIVNADDEEEEQLEEDEIQEIIETSAKIVKEPIINAKSAIIYDRQSKKVIWGKAENEKRAMASTTKILTATIVLEKGKLDDIVTISKKSANIGGSCLKLKENDTISVNDLLYGLMLRSRK